MVNPAASHGETSAGNSVSETPSASAGFQSRQAFQSEDVGERERPDEIHAVPARIAGTSGGRTRARGG